VTFKAGHGKKRENSPISIRDSQPAHPGDLVCFVQTVETALNMDEIITGLPASPYFLDKGRGNPVGILDEIVEKGIKAEKAVKEVSDGMQKLAFISLGHPAQVREIVITQVGKLIEQPLQGQPVLLFGPFDSIGELLI